jgi:hypothetical protein
MEPYDDTAAVKFKLSSNNDWLRRRQAVALPILPPNSPEARKYFFSHIDTFVAKASANGKRRIDYNDFAKEWNRSADGKYRYYVTPDVLSAYAKAWDKTNNARASQELIAAGMDLVQQTSKVFQESAASFPSYIARVPSNIHPQRGVIELNEHVPHSTPSSVTVELAISHPRIAPTEQIQRPQTRNAEATGPGPSRSMTSSSCNAQTEPQGAPSSAGWDGSNMDVDYTWDYSRA